MNETLPPVSKPSEAWRPYHFIGQTGGSLHIDHLPEVDSTAYAVLLDVSRADIKMAVKLSANELSVLSTAYRRTAIMTTAVLANLLTR